MDIKQIIPSKACLNCDVCCRYLERTTTLTPCFLDAEIKSLKNESAKLWAIDTKIDPKTPPISYKGLYICPFFIYEKNLCSIYHLRPLDCQAYPFMVTYGPDYKFIYLVVDTKCPYIKNKLESKEIKEYIEYLAQLFESESMVETINTNKNFINDFQEDSIILKRLERLSKRLCFSDFGLKRISLVDRHIFEEYFLKSNFSLSYYAFLPIYIWTNVLNIVWCKLNGAPCVFSGNNKDYFMPLPPLDNPINKAAIKESLQILSNLNKGGLSEINMENVPEEFLEDISSLGFSPKISSFEYIYDRQSLVGLKGDKYASKRSSINNLIKKYKAIFRPLQKTDIFSCLGLYRKWAGQKLKKINDNYARLLIEDSYFSHKTALFNLDGLGLTGYIVEIDKEIKGYTLGYKLNKEIFVVLFEITDLEIKGLPQFIFREFCAKLPYRYINAMDDSGLKSLRKTKESYHPIRKIPCHKATYSPMAN